MLISTMKEIRVAAFPNRSVINLPRGKALFQPAAGCLSEHFLHNLSSFRKYQNLASLSTICILTVNYPLISKQSRGTKISS